MSRRDDRRWLRLSRDHGRPRPACVPSGRGGGSFDVISKMVAGGRGGSTTANVIADRGDSCPTIQRVVGGDERDRRRTGR